jgi:hypothetical protein
MNKKLHTLLEMSQEEYYKLTFEKYMRWCEETSRKTGVSIQVIMANSKINSYYNYHYELLEMQVELMLKVQVGMSLEQIKVIYNAGTFIQNYPSALIEEAKKLKIENYYAN